MRSQSSQQQELLVQFGDRYDTVYMDSSQIPWEGNPMSDLLDRVHHIGL